MQQTQWNSSQIKQCKKEFGQAMLSDEHSLFSFGEDFGKLLRASPHAVFQPKDLDALQAILRYAHHQELPIVIRGRGLSQSGQSLPVEGGVTLHLEHFNRVLDQEDDAIWVEGNATFSDLLAVSLKNNQVPYVVPYNCNLSIGGVLSAGGVGAASFQYGTVISHIKALEVITADGEKHKLTPDDELFKACLGGQGQFGVISKACIALRPCKKNVRTFFLSYHDENQWRDDLYKVRRLADGLESFCTPAIQGAKLTGQGRFPFAEWLYAMHVMIEYDEIPPDVSRIHELLNPWKVLHQQDEPIDSYLHRHDSRFAAMKMTGQWELQHPWYECFIPAKALFPQLKQVVASLPVHYANILQVIPLASSLRDTLLALPDSEDICAVMILNPGIADVLLPSCLAAMQALDERFLKAGGKRYLSGFLGEEISSDYWRHHYNGQFEHWRQLKHDYDPKRIFQSHLFKSLNRR